MADKMYEEINLRVKESESKHQEVIKVYENEKLKQKELVEYIYKINACKKIGKTRIKTVIGIDGTNSMTYILKKAIEILHETFRRTY